MAKRGFTLIEALAAVVLLAVGIVASMGALSAVRRGEFRVRETELMLRLASDKYDEMVGTGQVLTPSSGDFIDRNEDRYTWSLSIEQSGVTDLNAIVVTVERAESPENGPRQQVTGFLFQPPLAAEAATP